MAEREYKDSEGNVVTLDKLVRIEPEWAANIIRWYESQLDATERRIVGCPEGMANLYKIAAAPELLSAARYALESLDAIDVPQEWDCRELLRTAIAKASGAETDEEPSE